MTQRERERGRERDGPVLPRCCLVTQSTALNVQGGFDHFVDEWLGARNAFRSRVFLSIAGMVVVTCLVPYAAQTMGMLLFLTAMNAMFSTAACKRSLTVPFLARPLSLSSLSLSLSRPVL